MATAVVDNIPAHVPADKVVSLRLFDRVVIPECPQETIIPEIHATLGPISWVSNAFMAHMGGWMLTRLEDVQEILRDPDNFTKKGMGKFAQSIGEDWAVIPTELDPPIHSEYRKALNPYFAPQKMAAMKGDLRKRATDLIDTFKDRGSCDFVHEFSEKFPIYIVLDLLGLPQERMPEFLVWEKEILHTKSLEERANGVRKVKTYLESEINNRRENPRDDYISRVLNYEVSGRKWTHDEVLGHCFNLYIGGLDTVTSLLGNIFTYLARYPEKQAELRADPSKIVTAVEELLRAFAPVSVFRIAAKELVIHGQKIMPGDYVGISTPIVGRDPSYYDNPGEVNFDRRAQHVSLGNGIHKCLGMHLARLELQTALEEFLKAVPPFRIKDGFKVGYFVGNILHVPELHLQWD